MWFDMIFHASHWIHCQIGSNTMQKHIKVAKTSGFHQMISQSHPKSVRMLANTRKYINLYTTHQYIPVIILCNDHPIPGSLVFGSDSESEATLLTLIHQTHLMRCDSGPWCCFTLLLQFVRLSWYNSIWSNGQIVNWVTPLHYYWYTNKHKMDQ